MYHGMVIVLLDQGTPGKTDSSLLALDAATGKTVWEAKRPVPNSWASPIIFTGAKGDQLVAAAKPWVISYDPATGTERWRAKVLDGDVAPSPVFGGGFVLAVNTGSKLAAIRPDGHGDVTATHVAWGAEDGLPDIVSPVTDGKYVWLMTTDGLLSCYAVKDGKPVYDKELDEAVKSSPTLVGDRLYISDVKGVTRIIGTGGEYKEISKAELGEPIHASPAFLDGRIYIRTTKHLFAIGKK
jgi:outer membrane protein assembly factor BamB